MNTTRTITASILLVLSVFALVTWQVAIASDGFTFVLDVGDELSYYWYLGDHAYRGLLQVFGGAGNPQVKVLYNMGEGWQAEPTWTMHPGETHPENAIWPRLSWVSLRQVAVQSLEKNVPLPVYLPVQFYP